MGVRWYVAYPLSTRHVEELMLERGVHVDHLTINRWVIKYSPQLEIYQSYNLHKTFCWPKNGCPCCQTAQQEPSQSVRIEVFSSKVRSSEDVGWTFAAPDVSVEAGHC